MADNQLRFEVNLNVDQAMSISVSVNESVDPAVLRNMFAAVIEGTQKQPPPPPSQQQQQQQQTSACPHPHPMSTSASSSLSHVATAKCHQQPPSLSSSSKHPHHLHHHHHHNSNNKSHSHRQHRHHQSKDDTTTTTAGAAAAAAAAAADNSNAMSVRERVAQLNSSRPMTGSRSLSHGHHDSDRPSSSIPQHGGQIERSRKPPHDMNVTFYSEKREFSSYPAVLLTASGIGGGGKGTNARASTSGVSNVGVAQNNDDHDDDEEECSRLHAQHSDHSHLRSTRRFMDDADIEAMDRGTRATTRGGDNDDDDDDGDDDGFESSRRLRNQLYKRHHKTLRVNKSLPPKVTLNDVNEMVFETTTNTNTNTTTTTTATTDDDDDDANNNNNIDDDDEEEDDDDDDVKNTNTGQDSKKPNNTNTSSGVTAATEQGPFTQPLTSLPSHSLAHARSMRRPSDVSAVVHNRRTDNNRMSDVIGPLSLPLTGGTRTKSTLALMSCTTDANSSSAPTTVAGKRKDAEQVGGNHVHITNLNEASEVTATEDDIPSAILLTRNGTVASHSHADGHTNNNNNNHTGLNKSNSAAAIVGGGGGGQHVHHHQLHHHRQSHGGMDMNTTTNSTAGSGIMGSTRDDADDWNDYMLHEPSYAGGLAGSAHGSRPSGSGRSGAAGGGGANTTTASFPDNHAGDVGGMTLGSGDEGAGGGMGTSLLGPKTATRPSGRPPPFDDETQLEKGEIPASVTTRMARFPLLSHISSRIGRTSCVGSTTGTHDKRGPRRTALLNIGGSGSSSGGGGIEEIHQGTLAEGLPVYSRDTIGRSRNLFGRGCAGGVGVGGSGVGGSKHGVDWLELSSSMEREELMDEVESVANKLNYDTRRVKGEDRIRCVKVLSHRKEMHMHIEFRSVNIPNEKCTVVRIMRPRSDRNRTDAWRYSHFYRELSETLNIRNIPLRN